MSVEQDDDLITDKGEWSGILDIHEDHGRKVPVDISKMIVDQERPGRSAGVLSIGAQASHKRAWILYASVAPRMQRYDGAILGSSDHSSVHPSQLPGSPPNQ